jgi:hypothetical protein
MARGIPADDAVRAAAIADVTLGCSISEAARKHGVSRTTVQRWCKAQGVDLATCAPLVPQKRTDLGARIAEYLDTGLQALTAQARVAGDPEYIKKQPAGELAILHGVLSDKLVRILAAIEPANPDSASSDRR